MPRLMTIPSHRRCMRAYRRCSNRPSFARREIQPHAGGSPVADLELLDIGHRNLGFARSVQEMHRSPRLEAVGRKRASVAHVDSDLAPRVEEPSKEVHHLAATAIDALFRSALAEIVLPHDLRIEQRLRLIEVLSLDRGGHAVNDLHVRAAAQTGITPCFFQGRSIRLLWAISSPRMIRGRVSRGSMMSSTMSFPAAMYGSMIDLKLSTSSLRVASGSSAASICL